MNPFQQFESQIHEERNQIKELKALLIRAADALEDWKQSPASCRGLIAELRKAAE